MIPTYKLIGSKHKVLLVGAGRRVSLAERFLDAGFDVFAYETEIKCPISEVATIIPGKKWDDPEIEENLIAAILKDDFDLLIPLMDPATVVLSRLSATSPKLNAKIPTSSESTNEICLNKRVFEVAFKDRDYYPSAQPYDKVIIKPIQGANSKGIKVLRGDEYWISSFKAGYDRTHIAQRHIENGTEYSIDAYFNKAGKMIDAVPRKRLEVQGGEVSRSVTVPRDHLGLVELTRSIGEEIGIVGPACSQFIAGEDNKPYVMEINSRFGGGVILSLQAGLDMVDLLKREYILGEKLEPKEYPWKEGFGMVRYFKEHFYEQQ